MTIIGLIGATVGAAATVSERHVHTTAVAAVRIEQTTVVAGIATVAAATDLD